MGIGLGLALPFAQRRILGAAELLDNVIDIVGVNEGAVFDVAAAFARGAIWEDSARTTPASVDGPVGSIQDELLRYYAAQATSAARPVLRTDGTGKYWLQGDGTQSLSFDFSNPFGQDFYAAVAARAAVLATVEIWGSRGTTDAFGQWSLRQTSGNMSLVLRQAGSNPSVNIASPNIGTDFVFDGRLSAIDSLRAVTLNGSAPVTGVVATMVGVAVNCKMFTGPNGTFSGRIYGAFAVDAYTTSPQRSIVRAWLASRCVNNPL